MSYTEGPISFEQLADQDALGQLLAKEHPKWEPGSTHGYHGMTFGLYVSQLLRRADPKHRTLGQFFKEEIAQAFGDYMLIINNILSCLRYPILLLGMLRGSNRGKGICVRSRGQGSNPL